MLKYKYASLALLNTVLIIYASSIPDRLLWANGSLSEQIISNFLHIPAYAVLTILWLKAFERRKNAGHSFKSLLLILVGLMLFAVSDEIHQSFVPVRMASFMDVCLDVIGIFIGLSIFRSFRMFNSFQEK